MRQLLTTVYEHRQPVENKDKVGNDWDEDVVAMTTEDVARYRKLRVRNRLWLAYMMTLVPSLVPLRSHNIPPRVIKSYKDVLKSALRPMYNNNNKQPELQPLIDSNNNV